MQQHIQYSKHSYSQHGYSKHSSGASLSQFARAGLPAASLFALMLAAGAFAAKEHVNGAAASSTLPGYAVAYYASHPITQ